MVFVAHWVCLCHLLLQHRPVFVERLGKLNGKRMEKEGASDQLALSYHLREMEFMAQVGPDSRIARVLAASRSASS